MKEPERLLTVKEVAKRLGVKEQWLRKEINQGKLWSHRFGPVHVRIRPSELESYIRASVNTSPAPCRRRKGAPAPKTICLRRRRR